MSYRVEVSATSRAGCSVKECKDNNVKIQKGEIRLGVLIALPDGNQSMKWRHWGCVTPTVLHNWWSTAEQNIELIDGLDELPEEAQEKVKLALEDGHVADEDWNGDLEMNRYNESNPKQGMYKRVSKKKQQENDGENDGDKTEIPVKSKGNKKRGRAADDEDIPKPAKKSKTSKKQDAENDDTPSETSKTARKSKTVKSEEDVEDAPIKKKRGAKSKSETVIKTEDVAPQANMKKARSRKTTDGNTSDSEVKAVTKRRNKKSQDENVVHDDEPVQKKGRTGKATAKSKKPTATEE